jgi:CRP/FNR family cyclic AMP-dependent transcriptional regulator
MDADRLLRISVFAALSDAELSRLAAFATEESFPVGARLIREGDFSTELYAIEEGTADIVRGGETIDVIKPGDIVGELGVLGKTTRNADVVVSSPMLAIKVSHWEIRRLAADTRQRLTELVDARRSTD